MSKDSRPLVLITGAAGDIGSTLAKTLESDYLVVGLDRPGSRAQCELIESDLTSDQSVDASPDAWVSRITRGVCAAQIHKVFT